MEPDVTRRDFLKKGALIGGGIAAVAGAGALTPLIVRERQAFDVNASFWAQAQPPKNPPLDRDIDADVAIIGGGYTGLSAAYHLARRFPRQTIVLVEARGVGHGASGRNGGMLVPQTSNDFMELYSDPRTHKLTYDLTVENLNAIQALLAAQGLSAAFDRCGALLVISSAYQAPGYREYASRARELGIPVTFWGREQTGQALGSDVYHGALYEPNAGQIHPMQLVRALKQAAEAAGAHIFEDSPVAEIVQGRVLSLRVGASRHINAKAVVLATNAYTSKLGFFRNSILPLHTHFAVTARLPEHTLDEIGWKRRIPYTDTRNFLYHLGCTPDNRIMIGVGKVDYFFNNGTVYRGSLHEPRQMYARELARIYPQLADVGFEYVWSGITDVTLDLNQSVGVMGRHRNIYYGLGYSGHGVNLAVLFGRIIAELHAGETGLWSKTPFFNRKLGDLPPEPLKWLGLQTIIRYYRELDKQGLGGRT